METMTMLTAVAFTTERETKKNIYMNSIQVFAMLVAFEMLERIEKKERNNNRIVDNFGHNLNSRINHEMSQVVCMFSYIAAFCCGM